MLQNVRLHNKINRNQHLSMYKTVVDGAVQLPVQKVFKKCKM